MGASEFYRKRATQMFLLSQVFFNSLVLMLHHTQH